MGKAHIAEWLTIVSMLIGAVVYAEQNYAKDKDIQSQFTALRVEQYQTKIDLLHNIEVHKGLSLEQQWELKYFQDKRDNVLKKSK